MTSLLSRRQILAHLAAVPASAVVWRVGTNAEAKVPMVVYRDAMCGCCHVWVDRMTLAGFAASVRQADNINTVKRAHGIAQPLWSCHTAIVDGYLIEGHVPADDIKRLLALRPPGVVGLAIPGMPASAPGMDLTPFRPYTVLSFDVQGRTAVFATHDAPA
jgi:hypothetical protein